MCQEVHQKTCLHRPVCVYGGQLQGHVCVCEQLCLWISKLLQNSSNYQMWDCSSGVREGGRDTFNPVCVGRSVLFKLFLWSVNAKVKSRAFYKSSWKSWYPNLYIWVTNITKCCHVKKKFTYLRSFQPHLIGLHQWIEFAPLAQSHTGTDN